MILSEKKIYYAKTESSEYPFLVFGIASNDDRTELILFLNTLMDRNIIIFGNIIEESLSRIYIKSTNGHGNKVLISLLDSKNYSKLNKYDPFVQAHSYEELKKNGLGDFTI